MKYFIYARKSQESEDRQVQSIDDQIKELKALAHKLNLIIENIFTESRSAKAPHKRPVYSNMIKRLEKGEANGILTWKIDRLSRNPVDSGEICWLLQQGIIKSIRTFEREYLPEDNVILLTVEGGMANQYIRELSQNVKRGMRSKLEKGWQPNLAPLGYLNSKNENKNDEIKNIIIRDPDRFDIVKKMWSLMLTGRYTPPKILAIANKEWGLRTRKHKKLGGKEITRSGIYKILTNPFYAGVINYYGSQHQGKHDPMITLDEYNRVQSLLGREGKSRPKQHSFAFTGFIRCGECGCLYTAETKTKYIKSTGKNHYYTYYHCTRKKCDINCSQKKVIREEELESKIEQELAKYTILPEFRDWALESLRQVNDKEISERSKIFEMQQKSINETQRQLDSLVSMRLRDLLSDEEYLQQKGALQAQLGQLRQNLKSTEDRTDHWIELTEKTFNFATQARKAFINGDMNIKKEIALALGSNWTIRNGKLSIEAHKWLIPIGNSYPALQEEFLRLEPKKDTANKEVEDALSSLRIKWLGRKDSNLRMTDSKPVDLPLVDSPT